MTNFKQFAETVARLLDCDIIEKEPGCWTLEKQGTRFELSEGMSNRYLEAILPKTPNDHYFLVNETVFKSVSKTASPTEAAELWEQTVRNGQYRATYANGLLVRLRALPQEIALAAHKLRRERDLKGGILVKQINDFRTRLALDDGRSFDVVFDPDVRGEPRLKISGNYPRDRQGAYLVGDLSLPKITVAADSDANKIFRAIDRRFWDEFSRAYETAASRAEENNRYFSRKERNIEALSMVAAKESSASGGFLTKHGRVEVFSDSANISFNHLPLELAKRLLAVENEYYANVLPY